MKRGLQRVESISYNHPISIRRADDVPNMKKINHNRSLETIIPAESKVLTINKKDNE